MAALKLAQGEILRARKEQVLYLIDDLPSELDQLRCERICRRLGAIGAQTLITSVESRSIDVDWLGGEESVAVFHVEHGSVTRA